MCIDSSFKKLMEQQTCPLWTVYNNQLHSILLYIVNWRTITLLIIEKFWGKDMLQNNPSRGSDFGIWLQ